MSAKLLAHSYHIYENAYWCSTCVQLVHETLVPRIHAVLEKLLNALKEAIFTQPLLREKEF